MLEVYRIKLFFMPSSGGVTDAHAFQGKDAILGGPVGGMVGMARTTELAFAGFSMATDGAVKVIGFDTLPSRFSFSKSLTKSTVE